MINKDKLNKLIEEIITYKRDGEIVEKASQFAEEIISRITFETNSTTWYEEITEKGWKRIYEAFYILESVIKKDKLLLEAVYRYHNDLFEDLVLSLRAVAYPGVKEVLIEKDGVEIIDGYELFGYDITLYTEAFPSKENAIFFHVFNHGAPSSIDELHGKEMAFSMLGGKPYIKTSSNRVNILVGICPTKKVVYTDDCGSRTDINGKRYPSCYVSGSQPRYEAFIDPAELVNPVIIELTHDDFEGLPSHTTDEYVDIITDIIAKKYTAMINTDKVYKAAAIKGYFLRKDLLLNEWFSVYSKVWSDKDRYAVIFELDDPSYERAKKEEIVAIVSLEDEYVVSLVNSVLKGEMLLNAIIDFDVKEELLSNNEVVGSHELIEIGTHGARKEEIKSLFNAIEVTNGEAIIVGGTARSIALSVLKGIDIEINDVDFSVIGDLMSTSVTTEEDVEFSAPHNSISAFMDTVDFNLNQAVIKKDGTIVITKAFMDAHMSEDAKVMMTLQDGNPTVREIIRACRFAAEFGIELDDIFYEAAKELDVYDVMEFRHIINRYEKYEGFIELLEDLLLEETASDFVNAYFHGIWPEEEWDDDDDNEEYDDDCDYSGDSDTDDEWGDFA